MDKLKCMEALVSVVDAGSFTLAGKKLGLTTVMVGRQIRQLAFSANDGHALRAVALAGAGPILQPEVICRADAQVGLAARRAA